MKKPIFTLLLALCFGALFGQSNHLQHVIVMMAERYDDSQLSQKTALMTKEQRRDFVIAEHLNVVSLKELNELRQERISYLTCHKDSLRCVTCGNVLGLCIQNDLESHIKISLIVDICVTYAVCVSENSYSRILHDVLNESIRTSRDDEVDITVKAQHLRNFCSGSDEIEPTFRKSRFDTCLADDLSQNSICIVCFASALEENGIAALETKGCDLNESIRPGLKDDTDNTDRACYSVELETLIKSRVELELAYRIFKADKALDTFCYVIELCLIEFESLI